MKNYEKNIIIAIISLILISVLLLGILEYKQQTGEDSQGWWSIYFVSPYDEKSLDFVIENYDKKIEFNYEVILNDEVIKSDKINVENGKFKKVELSNLNILKNNERSAEVKVNLSGEKENKSIFKK